MSTVASITETLRRGYADAAQCNFGSATDRASDVIQEVTVLLVGPYKHSEADEETLQRLLGAALVLLNGIADIAQASTRATAKALGDWEANLQRRPFRQNGRR
jgi:hypothetical protein